MFLQRAQSLEGPSEGRPESPCGMSTCSTSSPGEPGSGLAPRPHPPPQTVTVCPAFQPKVRTLCGHIIPLVQEVPKLDSWCVRRFAEVSLSLNN